MTRMLCSILSLFLFCSLLGGCSLFSSEDENQIEEVDTSSVGADEALDAELEDSLEDDALSDELGDLANDSEDFPEDSLDSELEESLDDEFASVELDDEQQDEFSNTNEDQIDQELAGDEFADFDEQAFSSADDFAPGDEFASSEPVVDVPLEAGPTNQPVVDIPQQAGVFANEITNLEYKAFENGGTVVIETAMPASYQTIENADLNQITIEVSDVRLPQRFKRPYITKDFKQDIATINAYADETKGTARFVIQLKRPITPLVQKEGSSILVMTGESSPVQTAASEQPLDQLVAQNEISMGATSSQSSGINAFGEVTKSGTDLSSGKFSGDPISVEFTDTDVRTIIEVIAEKSGVNLIMDDDVKGTTSLRLREVPWDQALLVTLRSKGLGYVKQGNVLRIAKQETLSKEAQAVSAQIRSEKEAKLLSSGLKVKYIPVSYADVSKLAEKLKEFLSEKGKIAFDDRTSSLVITDYGEYIERVVELTKALDTPPMQVEIAAKLVEAREEFTEEAGINWNTQGGTFSPGSQSGTINSRLSGSLPTNGGFSMDLSVGTFDIFGDLSATLGLFEQQDKIKILSQPRTVTMNKTKAVIEQVTQIPIQETTISAGVTTVTVEYRDLLLSLDVTPQITFKGDVILDVELKREFAGTEVFTGARELNRRRSKTTVMVKNGKTAVIGGIYQMDDTKTDTGIPLLKDIPLIGYLFKQRKDKKSKNELLLFLKPRIIKEIDDSVQVAAPGKNYDPFEEMSVDEGKSSDEPVVDIPSGDDDFDEIMDEDFNDEDFSDSEVL